jgi:ATP-binding cassette subfamily E protein 1
VLGLVGVNGVGKSTALNILSGKIKPNLGRLDQDVVSWEEIEAHYRGSGLQNYFKKLVEENLRTVIKPQYVDQIPKAMKVIQIKNFENSLYTIILRILIGKSAR